MKTLTDKQKREVMREMGARGGSTPTTKLKGFAAMVPDERKRIALLAVAARRKNGKGPK